MEVFRRTSLKRRIWLMQRIREKSPDYWYLMEGWATESVSSLIYGVWPVGYVHPASGHPSLPQATKTANKAGL
jgi:hypothetical protein